MFAQAGLLVSKTSKQRMNYMTKKIIIGVIIAAIALPALWFGASAYNDYRIRNCTLTEVPA